MKDLNWKQILCIHECQEQRRSDNFDIRSKLKRHYWILQLYQVSAYVQVISIVSEQMYAVDALMCCVWYSENCVI